jgi:SAM-dependent methyltransferase
MSQAAQAIDQGRAEAFADRLLDTLNTSALSLMISVGHRTGLFDAMGGGGAMTSEQIARGAGLHERYVRVWLGAMVTGRVVEYDPGERRYRLPVEHAMLLTRAAAPNNIAAFMQYIGVLGGVEDEIVDCFHNGGGVPYSSFTRFHEVMAEDSGQTVLPVLLDQILPMVPGLVSSLQRGIEVLDLGCGSGRALNLMARTFPNSKFRGIDLSEHAIEHARAEARRAGLLNVRFDTQDAALLAEAGRYALITTFDAIHDQAEPAKVLRVIQRALREDGTYLMQDISGTGKLEEDMQHPAGPFLYCVSTMHCMTVSLAQGGAGLGTMWGEELAQAMLREAGFTRIRIERLPHDFQNLYYIVRKD